MRVRTYVLIAVFVVLVWAGNAAAASFDHFGYEYTDEVGLGQLAGEILSISPFSVVAASISDQFFGLVNLAMFGSLAVAVWVDVRSVRRGVVVLVATLLVIAPLGLLALFSLIEALRLGLDGEWLGEGWPILEVFFFWEMAFFAYLVLEIGSPRRSDSSGRFSLRARSSQEPTLASSAGIAAGGSEPRSAELQQPGFVVSVKGFLTNLLRLPKPKRSKPELPSEVEFEHQRTMGGRGF